MLNAGFQTRAKYLMINNSDYFIGFSAFFMVQNIFFSIRLKMAVEECMRDASAEEEDILDRSTKRCKDHQMNVDSNVAMEKE